MDPEQTFIRVQERFSNMLTPRIRVALEYVYLVVAVSLFALLVVMHANYVQQPGCSSELFVVETAEAQLVHIKITSIGLHSHSEVESDEKYIPAPLPASDNVEAPTVDGDGLAFLGAKFWLNWFNSGVRRSKLVVKSSKTDTEYLEPQADSSVDGGSFIVEEKETKGSAEVSYAGLSTSAKESVKAAVGRFCSRWQRRFSFCYKHAKNFLWSFSQLLVETYSTERAQRKVKRHSAAALVAMDATVPDVKQQDQSTIHNVAGNISQLHSEDVKDDQGGSSKSKTKKGS